MLPWWPALVFGWPGPILATILSVIGIVRARAAWLLGAAVALVPFSFYLRGNTWFRWGILLPLLPLIAARALSRGSRRLAWLMVLLLTAALLGIARLVFR